jgi:CHAT domain-containing protein
MNRSPQFVVLLRVFFSLLLIGQVVVAADQAPQNISSDDLLASGYDAYRRGNFDQAVMQWNEAVQAYAKAGRVREQSEALLAMAQAHQSLGLYNAAVSDLDAALSLAERGGDTVRQAEILGSAGSLYVAMGDTEKAEQYLPKALQLARDQGNLVLTATLLNNLGRLRYSQSKIEEALQAYQESISVAHAAKNGSAAVRSHINMDGVLLESGRYADAGRELGESLQAVQRLDDSYDKAIGLLTLGRIADRLRPYLPENSQELSLQAFNAYNLASEIAMRIENARAASYAFGYMGGLYESERRYGEAMDLTDRAILAGQQAIAPEALYRWYWQKGRLLKQQGSTDDAIPTYRRAMAALESIRPELVPTPTGKSYREQAGAVYFDLADLLLRRAALQPSHEQEKPLLAEARDVIEKFKGAELRDYFRDDCVDAARSRAGDVEKASQNTAVLYPIPLADRLELLISIEGDLRRVAVPVGVDKLTSEVRAFRLRLEKRTTHRYRPHAQQLYDWLIRPILPLIESRSIDTLVIVPDGALRTIPFSALHDGEQFLIQRYAIATVPGLTLTDARPFGRTGARALTAGLSQEVQNFPPLPNVTEELKTVQRLYPGTLLVNQEFVLPRLDKELKRQDFTIVHIASHGEFDRDVRKSFVLAFDDKLTMDKLDQFIGLLRFREIPLGLLTLSACQTAAGDDRAALGLAGVALKAGAASALATLWFINDDASTTLVSEFYEQLKGSPVSKAIALQRAQLNMLDDPTYQHPAYWSPFLLLSNWL